MSRPRSQAHQNTRAFKHNPRSKKTAQILAIPNAGLCQRCHAIIEWRKKYRKYKPLKQPASCVQCKQRSVKFAYHQACGPCANARHVCPKCLQDRDLMHAPERPLDEESLLALLDGSFIRERRRRVIVRKWETSECTDDEIRAMVAEYNAEGASKVGLDDDDEDGSDEEENGKSSHPALVHPLAAAAAAAAPANPSVPMQQPFSDHVEEEDDDDGEFDDDENFDEDD